MIGFAKLAKPSNSLQQVYYRRSTSISPSHRSMITLTIVRHGESTDNLKPLWAGWSDAPLSVHGMNQAKALGESFKSTRVDAIYASDLLRALWTAQQIERNQAQRPPFTTSSLLREQNFGIAEHKPFGKEYTRGPGRSFKFEDGESLNDVRARANEAFSQFIERHLQECRRRPPTTRHIVVVAHGIFNAEFIGGLLARRGAQGLDWGYKGMTNTGWTRLELGYEDEMTNPHDADLKTNPDPAVTPSSRPAEPPEVDENQVQLPRLNVRIISTDVTKHLDGIHRQKGGIGSQGFDSSQKDLRAFFSGGSK
ncbi:histidine phosphatase superfamily [Kockovaella imperatae]|uniref:Histidine phosphatase superfamily n=1 Tax=Kockovaella imperatae TaxID=4999 RepID=A0A1Y1UCG4_9TREE|nr:histidine phosphatase superfamily [Kockovaella imperatae]ORX34765.1 histidine phosphatase superfamily [Kockovaella imperatae]